MKILLGVLLAASLWGVPRAFGRPSVREDVSPNALRRQAADAFKEGRWAAGRDAANRYLQWAPSDAPKARMGLLLAECLIKQGKFAEALAALTRAQKEADREPFLYWSARLRAAEVSARLGAIGKAQSLLQETANCPIPALASEARLDQGVLLLRQGREAEAQQVLQDLLANSPQYRADAQMGRALGYLLLKTGSAPQANDFLQRSIAQADWGDPKHLFLQAMAYRALGKTREANRFFQLSYKYSDSEEWKAESLYQIGEGMLQLKMLPLARQSFEAILTQHPKTPSRAKALQRLAIIALEEGEPKEAAARAKQLLAPPASGGAPDEALGAQADYILGETALRAREFQRAKIFFEKAAGAPSIAMEARLKLVWLALEMEDYNLGIRLADDFLREFSWGDMSGHALLLRGLGYQKAGSLDKASADFVRFIDAYPQHPLQEKAIYLLAYNYLQGGKWAELISHVSVAVQKLAPRPTQWQAGIQFSIAEGNYQLGRYEEALGVYRALARRFPPGPLFPYIYQGIALCDGKLERYDQAFAAQERALSFSKTYKNREIVRYGLLTLGDLLFNKRKYKSALSYYDAFLKNFPDDALLPDALYRSAMTLSRLRRPQPALERWSKLAKQYPSSPYAPQALLEMGRYYFKIGLHRQTEQTLAQLFKLAPAPEAREALLLSAQNLFNQGLYQEAISRYEEFKQKYPDQEGAQQAEKFLETSLYQLALQENKPDRFLAKYPDSPMAEDLFWDLGLKYWNAKDYDKALESFQQLALHFPDRDKTKRATYMMAEIYFRKEDFKSAAASYSSYLESNPPEAKLLPKALFHKAVSLFRAEALEEASAAFAQFLAKYPDDPQARDAGYNLVLAYLKAKQPEQGLAACKDFLKRFPDDSEGAFILLQMGHALKSMGQAQEAAAMFRKVPKSSPQAIEAYYNLGQLYQEGEEFDEARKAYALLVPLRPRDNELRLSGIALLAEFYERLGKKARSLELYREVAKLSKNPEWAVAAKQKVLSLQQEVKGGIAP